MPDEIPTEDLDQKVIDGLKIHSAVLGLHRMWRETMAKNKRYHRWPNFEVLELLNDDEDRMCGFSVHFSNGTKATFRRTANGVEAANPEFERDGSINYSGGLIDTLRQEWWIDGQPFDGCDKNDQAG